MRKANILKNFITVLFCILGSLGMAADALAAAQFFGTATTGTVGLATSGAARTDVYTITCAAGTASLSVMVRDLAPVKAPLVSIQVTKGTATSALSADTVDADAKFSPLVKLAKGSGVYTMKVNKSTSSVKGAEVYLARFNCRNAKGAPTPTKRMATQNQ
jgi:hypothetical protein